MEKHPFRNALIGLGLSAAIIGGAALRPDQRIMDGDDYALRNEVFETYPFTAPAIRYLREIPFFNRNTTTNGGGLWHGDDLIPYAEVFSHEHEAAIHELTHAWHDKMEREDPTFRDRFLEDAHRAGQRDVPYGFYWVLEHGHPGTDFKGLGNNSTEWFASMGSKVMGNVYGMPEEVKEHYSSLFRWTPGLDEGVEQYIQDPNFHYFDHLWKTNDQ